MKKYLMIPAVLLFPLCSFAEVLQYDNPFGKNIVSLPGLAQVVLGNAVKIAIPFAAVMLVYSGFLFVTANGNEKNIASAKNAFKWTVIGIGVSLGAWALSLAFNSTIGSLF